MIDASHGANHVGIGAPLGAPLTKSTIRWMGLVLHCTVDGSVASTPQEWSSYSPYNPLLKWHGSSQLWGQRP